MLEKFTKILTVAVMGALFLPVISSALLNIDIPHALSNELGVEITPAYPRPNERISISLSLYTADLNSANITWYKDGKKVLSGKGEVSYSFLAGPIGEETKIEIRITLVDGMPFSKTFTLIPASVDLVWEANSYVPPFYKGKALHPRQGSLKIFASPEFVRSGRRISPANLIYEWSNGLEVYQSQSGYGKSTLVINGSPLGREERVEVLVSDPANGLAAQGFINISPVSPEIVFYENNPYYGHIFETSISNTFDLGGEEVQILAAPYYFTKERTGPIKYEWKLNGVSVPNLSGLRTAIFRKPEGEAGRSVVSLQMENSNRILQQAGGSLIMNFSD